MTVRHNNSLATARQNAHRQACFLHPCPAGDPGPGSSSEPTENPGESQALMRPSRSRLDGQSARTDCVSRIRRRLANHRCGRMPRRCQRAFGITPMLLIITYRTCSVKKKFLLVVETNLPNSQVLRLAWVASGSVISGESSPLSNRVCRRTTYSASCGFLYFWPKQNRNWLLDLVCASTELSKPSGISSKDSAFSRLHGGGNAIQVALEPFENTSFRL